MEMVRSVRLSTYCDGYDSVLVMHLMCVLYKLNVIGDIVAPANYDIHVDRMVRFALDYLRGNPHIFLDPKIKNKRSSLYELY